MGYSLSRDYKHGVDQTDLAREQEHHLTTARTVQIPKSN